MLSRNAYARSSPCSARILKRLRLAGQRQPPKYSRHRNQILLVNRRRHISQPLHGLGNHPKAPLLMDCIISENSHHCSFYRLDFLSKEMAADRGWDGEYDALESRYCLWMPKMSQQMVYVTVRHQPRRWKIWRTTPVCNIGFTPSLESTATQATDYWKCKLAGMM